jgi:hypothetical protein
MKKDVMRNVALRRKMIPKKPHPNGRQLPVFIVDDEPENRQKQYATTKSVRTHRLSSEFSHHDNLPPPFVTFYPGLGTSPPTMLAQCNLDFRDLSILASHEVGRFTGRRLLENPGLFPHFLGKKNLSYCQFVPLHYGRNNCIRYAVDCAVARARCLLSPSETQWELLALSSYTKAISTLQKALDSVSSQCTVEILCATQILALYEVSRF